MPENPWCCRGFSFNSPQKNTHTKKKTPEGPHQQKKNHQKKKTRLATKQQSSNKQTPPKTIKNHQSATTTVEEL
jgi:hypothetical protein